MSGPDKGGLHPDPLDPGEPAPDPATFSEIMSRAARSPALDRFRDSLRLDGGSVRDGVIADLSEYYSLPPEEVVDRCVHWEEWSTAEWSSDDRESPAGITDFYRTTRSWSFDLLWFAYLQAELYRYPVSAAIASELADQGVTRGRHLDFGCGVGVTSQMFHRLGFESDMADIATSMLEFAQFRHGRRGDHIRPIDLNDDQLDTARYDVVTAIDTLVHIPDLETVLRQLHDAIATDGLLFANFAVRPRTAENAQFLYDDELPLQRLIQRVGFRPERRLDGMITQYRRVEPTGWQHAVRRLRASIEFSPLRPLVRSARDRARGLLHRR